MKILTTISEMQSHARRWHTAGSRVGLVPTMGYFHDGHLSLMREARKRADVVVTSLFVNPMQFGPAEDLDAYPRDFERDCQLARDVGVDFLFSPQPVEMYGENFQTSIEVKKVSQGLCGADRPGHFTGVATVVAKLFNLTQADIAIFGEKDFQQLAVIRQMVADLNIDIEIIGHPIVREDDGLAMSSRNRYLNDSERKAATCLYRAIRAARKLIKTSGRPVPVEEVEKMARDIIVAHKECSVEYVKVINAETLQPVPVADQNCVLTLAMKVNGKVRLIDNSRLDEDHYANRILKETT